MNKVLNLLQTQLVKPFLLSFKRFPETVITGLVIMVLTYVSIWSPFTQLMSTIMDDVITPMWLMLILFAAWTLWREQHPSSNLVRWIGDNVIVAIGIIYYLAAPTATNSLIELTRYSALIGIAVLGFFIAPYYLNRKGFALYSLHVFTKALVTAFYSGVIWLGFSAILVTIEGLFRVNIDGDWYSYLYATIIGLTTIPVFLGQVPSAIESFETSTMNKIWRTVFVTIIVPLLFVFTLILSVYLLSQLIPSSPYEPMVYLGSALALAIVGGLMLVLTEPVAQDYPHIQFFIKYWPFALLFIVAGYYFEGIRGALSNGFATVHAFFLFLGLFPIGVLVTHFKWQALRPMMTLLVAVDTLTLTFLAPYINAFAVTRYVLASEWKSLLVANNMWVNNEIVPNPSASTEVIGRFSHILTRASEVGLDILIGLPDDFDLFDAPDVLGFEFDATWNPIDRISYHNLSSEETTSLPSGAYDAIAFMAGLETIEFDDYMLSYSESTDLVTLRQTDVIVSFDIEEIASALKPYSLTAENVIRSNDQLTFTIANGEDQLILAIHSISFTYDPDTSDYDLTYWQVLVGVVRG